MSCGSLAPKLLKGDKSKKNKNNTGKNMGGCSACHNIKRRYVCVSLNLTLLMFYLCCFKLYTSYVLSMLF